MTRSWWIFLTFVMSLIVPAASAEPVPLKRMIELALTHSSTAVSAAADEQRAVASYHEARNQYFPQIVAGSGLGASYGFPLTLEGSAPSIVNINAGSALLNASLRDFVRAAKTDSNATTAQSKDQRNEVIQDTVLNYAELSKWQGLLSRLEQEQADAAKMEQIVEQRIQAGVENPVERRRAQLSVARIRYRAAEAGTAIDVIRRHLAQLTGLSADSIDADPDSIPALPEMKEDDSLAAKAAQTSPAVQSADLHAEAESLRAKGEHRALWPTVDFAAQYALLSNFNNYAEFYKSFQRNNASIGVAIRFPFLNLSQHAHAQAADAAALRAQQDAKATRNKISEEALRLQDSVQQLAAARDVADLEHQIAQGNAETLQTRYNAGSASLSDLQDAQDQANVRLDALQDANFELEKARIMLLRATGELSDWAGVGK